MQDIARMDVLWKKPKALRALREQHTLMIRLERVFTLAGARMHEEFRQKGTWNLRGIRERIPFLGPV